MNEFSWLSFADVGKRLGEMWHSLSEDEKEEYRRRSRAIADQKLREWHERMKMFPPHQQASNLVAQVSSQVIQPEYVWHLVQGACAKVRLNSDGFSDNVFEAIAMTILPF
jgi:hypothetical protein